ncbi:PfkB family carbohydrate kinase [Salmonella enterica]
MDIAVIGSNMVDLITYTNQMPKEGETLEAPAFKIGCGGKGANQAVAAAKLNSKVLMLTKVGDSLRVTGRYEYVMGFGHHYQAQPAVVMRKASALFDILMTVTNLASVAMPLQYMCHMNYAYVPNATFRQNIPDTALKLRESVPAHVKPTAQWLAFNQRLLQGEASLATLNEPGFYDPEIVFFADELDKYTDTPEFSMIAPDGTTFVTRFASAELNYVTRWILYNGDQQVAAFALPATCRPEGFLAAQRNGTLLQLEPQQTRTFTVTTGIV